MGELARKRFPRREGESDARWEGRIRSSYVDVCRYLLPAAVLANVGITINARALEHALRKMLSHPLMEVRAIGAEVKRAALSEVPTLVKYADENAYLRETPDRFRAASGGLGISGGNAEPAPRGWMKLIRTDPNSEDLALAAAGVRFCGWGFEDALARIHGASAGQKKALADAMLGTLGDHDIPLRELEYVAYTFESRMDQGAYFEVKRHRMSSQTPGPLTCGLGYLTPRWIEEAGFRGEYDSAMQQAASACRMVARELGPETAAYLVPNGYLRRLVLGMNLREAFHFCALRSSESAHAAVRILALQAAGQIRSAHPLLGAYLKTEEGLDWRKLEEEFFL